ncbi:hypothetical protein [Spirosoma sp. KUDC1026]|uniref:hypothetical protein n=1 Tax=Spirosoma sp. KUDC1026 TaxID=2745947 RepID=UPI00159BBF7E|nr:hypothetical protein [Spirosoma sp. KUDC1026]QKZ14675.1 hypothetical protein HU175_19395 [Spirosoma sp. KUDC1026]
MLKELSTFTQLLDADLKEIGVEPREGLHIVLSLEESPEGELRIADQFEYALYRRKKIDQNEGPLKKCAAWARAAWMVDEDTNKCIDKTTKAIHSCSPFCLAIKRQNLVGGKKLMERQAEGKPIVYGSLKSYFDKAIEFIDGVEKEQAKLFIDSLNSQEKIHDFLSRIDKEEEKMIVEDNKYKASGYKQLKEGEYVIFYLNVPLPVYKSAYDKYLFDKIFSVNLFNTPKGPITNETKGLSAFFNGLPDKKPFLAHKTASFDISGRITAEDALALVEFKQMVGRTLPNPLPIFIFSDELPKVNLRQNLFRIFKEDAPKDWEKRKTHAQIITELYDKHKDELGNYYLLYYQQGQIKDFDFVSRFEYHLRDDYNKQDWLEIKNIMGVASTNKQIKTYHDIRDTFQLLTAVFTPLIGNKYLKIDNFFGDIDAKEYIINTVKPEQHLTMTKLAALTYRNAVYDYVYKSKRDAINHHSFWNMVVSTFSDDLKYERDYQLKEKLNILFSLNHFFDPENRNFNGLYMPDKLEQLTTKTMQIADSRERVPLEDEYEFAFIAGQMIDYLLSLSKTSDTSHAVLEGFLQKTDIDLFKQEIIRVFERYKHEVERPANLFKNRVSNLMREIMGYFPEKRIDLKKLQVFILAGYFSPSFIYTKKQTDSN